MPSFNIGNFQRSRGLSSRSQSRSVPVDRTAVLAAAARARSSTAFEFEQPTPWSQRHHSSSQHRHSHRRRAATTTAALVASSLLSDVADMRYGTSGSRYSIDEDTNHSNGDCDGGGDGGGDGDGDCDGDGDGGGGGDVEQRGGRRRPSSSFSSSSSCRVGCERWWILLVYCLLAAVQAATWNTFSPIYPAVYLAFPSWDSAFVNWLINATNISFVLLLWPAAIAAQKRGTRVVTLVSAISVFMCCGLRCLPLGDTVGQRVAMVFSMLFNGAGGE